MGTNRWFLLIMTCTWSCDRPYATFQLYFRLPTSQINTHNVRWAALSGKKKNKAQERTAAFVKYHWQPSILSWEENLLRVKSVIAKPEALHRYVVLRKDRGTQLEVSRTAIIWDTLCKWARTLWLTTTKAWFISAPSVYELRRWRSLIKCCRGQQQCVQEKESIL